MALQAPFPPRLALVAAVLAVSWGSILARLCESGPLAISFYRVLLSALIVLPFAAPGLSSAAGRGREGRGRLWLLIFLSGLLLALHFATWISSLSYTSIGASVLLVSTSPIFALILSRLFLGEAASFKTLIAVVVSLAGTFLIAGGDLGAAGDRWKGDLLALAGAAAGAGYFMIGRKVKEEIPFGPYLLAVYGASAAILAGIAAMGGELAGADLRHDWLFFLLMALGPGVAGHGVLNWTLRHLRVYVVNAALLGEPVLATIYAWLIFSEVPGLHVYAGGALILGGLAWVFVEEDRRRRSAPHQAH